MVRRRQRSRRPRRRSEIAETIDSFTDGIDGYLDQGIEIATSIERLVDKVAKIVPTTDTDIARQETRRITNVAMSMTPEAACSILNVPVNATMPQITRAYVDAIKTCRPDVSNAPKDRRKFIGYHTAYMVLKRRSRGQKSNIPVAIVEKKEKDADERQTP